MSEYQVRRRLAAIVAADVAGYTSLMERDTDGTVAAWQAAREEVIKPQVGSHSGKIVKLTGDGFLAEFPTVHDAVECAIAMQAGLASGSLRFRMGINLGDIVDDGADIHGEGVNIAARIEGLAEPGDICVSGEVYAQVRNRIDAVYDDLGERAVKNVSAPVRVYRIRSPGKEKESAPSVTAAEQAIRFCSAPDGARLAYTTLGKGPPVIIVANWLTHLEHDMKAPWRWALIERLVPNHRVIRYDARGNGLSDRDVETISFEASVGDLSTVINALELNRVALIGMSQGAAIAAAYAARHPYRITHLVLYGGYPRGRRMRGSADEIAESDALITLIRQGWGKDIDAYVRMFGTFFMPDANAEQLSRFTLLQRIATSPENAARIHLALDNIDILDELSNIAAPTLVLHVRDDARAPFEEGRRMAAAIPGARFVPLEGRNHSLLEGEPAFRRFLDEIEGFLNS